MPLQSPKQWLGGRASPQWNFTALLSTERLSHLSPLPRSSSRRRRGWILPTFCHDVERINLRGRTWSHGKCTFLGAWATSHWRHDTCGFFLWNLLNIFDYICMIIILILDNIYIYICNMHIIDYNSNNTGKPRRRRHVWTSKTLRFVAQNAHVQDHGFHLATHSLATCALNVTTT